MRKYYSNERIRKISKKKIRQMQISIRKEDKKREESTENLDNEINDSTLSKITEETIKQKSKINNNYQIDNLINYEENNSENEKYFSTTLYPNKNIKITKNFLDDKKYKEDLIEENYLKELNKKNVKIVNSKIDQKKEYNNHLINLIIEKKRDIINSKLEKKNSFDELTSFPFVEDKLGYEKYMRKNMEEINVNKKIVIPKIENFEKIKNGYFEKKNTKDIFNNNNNTKNYKMLSNLNNQKLMLLNKYSQKLNTEWIPLFDKNGVVYFYNRITGNTSFNFPKVFNNDTNRYENLL